MPWSRIAAPHKALLEPKPRFPSGTQKTLKHTQYICNPSGFLEKTYLGKQCRRHPLLILLCAFPFCDLTNMPTIILS